MHSTLSSRRRKSAPSAFVNDGMMMSNGVLTSAAVLTSHGKFVPCRAVLLSLMIMLGSAVDGFVPRGGSFGGVARTDRISIRNRHHHERAGSSINHHDSLFLDSQRGAARSVTAPATIASSSSAAALSSSLHWLAPSRLFRMSRRPMLWTSSASTHWATASPQNATTVVAFRNDATTSQLFQDNSNILAKTIQRRRQVEPRRSLFPTAARQQQFKIFCDLDGVLVDFEAGMRQLFPAEYEAAMSRQESWDIDSTLNRRIMWEHVQAAPAFFERLPWTADGRKLWLAIQPLQPDILTGVPQHVAARHEKVRWCQRELGIPVYHIDKAGKLRQHAPVKPQQSSTTASASSELAPVCRVITCWSDNKHYESGPGKVLIDDRIALRDNWTRAGGIFIHHRSTTETLQQLRHYGILRQQAIDQQEVMDDDYYLVQDMRFDCTVDTLNNSNDSLDLVTDEYQSLYRCPPCHGHQTVNRSLEGLLP